MSAAVVTYEQYCRIQEVREARERIPTTKELAAELGLKFRTVENAMFGPQTRHYTRRQKELAQRHKEAVPCAQCAGGVE